MTTKKPAPAKATTKAKAANKDAPKRTNTRNVGKQCSVRDCTHDATRRGLCSGRNRDGSKAAGHYRKSLRAENGDTTS